MSNTLYWHGMLCHETRDAIAERMCAVLDGNYFTLVICNSYDENSDLFRSVEVRPSQRITSPIQDYQDRSLAGISWGTAGLSMGVHTSARTQGEARDGRPHQFVQFTFERDQIEIDHYAPAGYRLLWVFAVERNGTEESS